MSASNGGPQPLGALADLKVVEFAHVIAGPLAGTLLADLGADVVHVDEPHNGDPGRKMGPSKEGVYLWWKVSARNKRSVTLDLRTSEGQAVAHQLIRWADVVISNFRQDTLRSWSLDWESIHRVNPGAIFLQVSGFGAKSSLANAPGFGKVGEARSGVVHLTGFPDGPPIHTGFSHADSVTGLMGAFAITAALHRRETDPEWDGEWIDLALFESLYRLIEWQVVFYDQLGVAPARSGNQLAAAPAAVINTYQARGGEWLTVTSGTPRSVQNVARLLDIPQELVATVEDQTENAGLLDDRLRTWISERTVDECLTEMRRLEVTASPIFSVADIMADEIYQELGDIITVDDPELGDLRMQGVIPRLHNHTGSVWRAGPTLGQDDDHVYGEYLGISPEQIATLREQGVIRTAEEAATTNDGETDV